MSTQDQDPSDYCRQVEQYLCRKNDGHLIRIVGPSFDLVSGWAAAGIPLQIALQGIDRYFERYYRKGPRRRPVRIDFCDADVLDVFDEWRRAVGLPARSAASAPGDAAEGAAPAPSTSVPAHLERALLKLTNARATGRVGPAADAIIDRLNDELDRARASRGGVRGEARRALADRLAALDGEMMTVVRATLSGDDERRQVREAAHELAAFRATMPADRYERALEAAVTRRLRDRAGLPSLRLP